MSMSIWPSQIKPTRLGGFGLSSRHHEANPISVYLMQTQLHVGLPLSIRFAQSINRMLSWGMTQADRSTFLAEALADWEEMYRDRGSLGVLERAVRGIPAGIWARLDQNDTTALPAAMAIAAVGVGGIGAGLLDGTYSFDIRRFVLVSAIGTLLLGATLMRYPRRIVLRKYRVASLMLATGFIGMAANMPTSDEWQYDTPFVDTVVADRLIAAGFIAVGVGFAAVFIASLITHRRPVAVVAGWGIMIGTILFSFGQISWGLSAVGTDLKITVVSIVVALGSLSFAHVMPRLRKLEIV